MCNNPSIEPLIKSFNKIAKLLEIDGRILISIPYGYREVLTHPITGKISSQIFDYESLIEGIKVLNELNIKTNLEVFESKEYGWDIVKPSPAGTKRYKILVRFQKGIERLRNRWPFNIKDIING